MARILSIDYGLKRIGLAVTDPSNIISQPLCTLNQNQIEAFLKDYIEKEQIEDVVLGMPYELDGTEGDMAKKVRSFANRLSQNFKGIKIHYIDERFSSSSAKKAILMSGVSKKRRREKEIVDKVSACIILQSFLNRKSPK